MSHENMNVCVCWFSDKRFDWLSLVKLESKAPKLSQAKRRDCDTSCVTVFTTSELTPYVYWFIYFIFFTLTWPVCAPTPDCSSCCRMCFRLDDRRAEVTVCNRLSRRRHLNTKSFSGIFQLLHRLPMNDPHFPFGCRLYLGPSALQRNSPQPSALLGSMQTHCTAVLRCVCVCVYFKITTLPYFGEVFFFQSLRLVCRVLRDTEDTLVGAMISHDFCWQLFLLFPLYGGSLTEAANSLISLTDGC